MPPHIVLHRIMIEIVANGASLNEAGAEKLADAVDDAVFTGAIAGAVLDALLDAGLPKECDAAIALHVEVAR